MKPERLCGKQVSHEWELCNSKFILGTARTDKSWEAAALYCEEMCMAALRSTRWALTAHLAGKECVIRPQNSTGPIPAPFHLPMERKVGSNIHVPFCTSMEVKINNIHKLFFLSESFPPAPLCVRWF